MSDVHQTPMVAGAGTLGAAFSKASPKTKRKVIKGDHTFLKESSIIGPTPPIPKQKRNAPCGCGSGVKSKKCCGTYPRQRIEQ